MGSILRFDVGDVVWCCFSDVGVGSSDVGDLNLVSPLTLQC